MVAGVVRPVVSPFIITAAPEGVEVRAMEPRSATSGERRVETFCGLAFESRTTCSKS